ALIKCFHWFNPFVWLMEHIARTDRELACDVWVLKKLGSDERESYGNTLMKTVNFLRQPWLSAPNAIAMAASRQHLFLRAKNIGSFRPASRMEIVAGMILLVLVGIGLLTNRTAAQDQTPITPPEITSHLPETNAGES